MIPDLSWQPAPGAHTAGPLPPASLLEEWLRQKDPAVLSHLWSAADRVRKEWVGEMVHLRGLIEIGNVCRRCCAYCGLAADRANITRYRMEDDEILTAAAEAKSLGFGTVVLQGGEDLSFSTERVEYLVREILSRTGLAITLSLGEREDEELVRWRKAGADRYLLRFESSNPLLYQRIHPDVPGKISDRMAILRRLKALDYEVGSGVMIGIPGQTPADLAQDLLAFRALDLDMVGMGPYLAHPDTPLGREAQSLSAANPDQTQPDELTTTIMVALTRLLLPWANLPATTALATINKASGREHGLQRGANIIMPNVTPLKYRKLYEIYPAKACVDETARQCHGCLSKRIQNVGRVFGHGPGHAKSNRKSRT